MSQPTSLLPVVQKSDLPDTGGAYIDDPAFDVGDLVVPTLKLLQGMSEPVQQGEPGAKPGVFWSPFNNAPIEPPMHVLIVFMTKNRWKRDNPKAGTQKCVSFDTINGSTYGKCDHCNFKDWTRSREGDSKPECALIYVAYALTPDGLCAIRFRGKAEKAAKTAWTTKVTQEKNWWTWPCLLGVKKEQGKDPTGAPTTYWAPTIWWDKAKPVAPELVAMAQKTAQMIVMADKSGRLKGTEDEGEDAET